MNKIVCSEVDKLLRPKIKIKLVVNNLQQKKLAEEMNVTPQVLNRWTSGKGNPTLDTAFKLARRLNCTVDELWEYVEDEEE